MKLAKLNTKEDLNDRSLKNSINIQNSDNTNHFD